MVCVSKELLSFTHLFTRGTRSGGSALAAFRPVFSVRVPRMDPFVDFVVVGCGCGRVDLNSAVCPPRLNFDASFTARYRSEVWLCLYTSAYDGF